MGMTTNVVLWGVSRYLAGLSTAAGMLLGTGLILNWLIRHDHRSELGIHFSGIGFGIAGCSAAVALMNHFQLDWRTQWVCVCRHRSRLALAGARLATRARSDDGDARREP